MRPSTGQGRRLAPGAALLVALALLGGCREREEKPASDSLPDDLAQVLSQVAALRGLPAPAGVRAGVLERDEVRDAVDGALSDGDREQFARLTTLYRLLGFIGPEDDYEDAYLDFVAEALIGYYEPHADEFFIVGDGDRIELGRLDGLQRSTLAHEFVHAAQDHAFDLPKLFDRAAGDLDWTLALNAVIEGDAVIHEGLWTREHPGTPGAGGSSAGAQRAAASVPAAVERELRFPYSAGTEWVSIIRGQRGEAAVDAVLEGRRVTTAEILHPELFGTAWKARDVVLPDVSSALGDGWKRTGGGAFGEFNLRNLLQLQLQGLPTVTGAAGWAGDRYDIYSHERDSVAVLRVAFESGEERAQFMDAIQAWIRAAAIGGSSSAKAVQLRDGRGLAVMGVAQDEVLLVFATDVATAEKVMTVVVRA